MPIIAFETDLHFEFHRDGGRSYIATMDPTDVDVLILGGDIALAKQLADVLKRLRDKYPAIVTVLGNHEYYTNNVSRVLEIVDRIQIPGVHVLRRQIVAVAGVKIAGTTLWFRKPIDYNTILAKRDMSDFQVIKGFEPFVYEENARDRAFLDGLRHGDAHVIVTHHLPHHGCIVEQFRGDPLNPFFLCDMTPAIERARPLLWLHGHTHSWVDHKVGTTRIVANPLGYPHALNEHHKENLKFLIVPEAEMVEIHPARSP
jgi:Icc-related predicted phosphoesterase